MAPVRVLLFTVLALAGACDRSPERRAQDTPPAPAAVADAASPALAQADAAPAQPAVADAAQPVLAQPAADAALSADAAVAAAPGTELVVTASPLKPRTQSIVTFDAKLDFDLNLGAMQTNSSTTQSKKKKVEILAVDPDGTVHKRITYTRRDTSAIVDGERKKDPSPIRGKTYRVTWKDGIVDVRLPGGKPASAAEVDAIRSEETVLGAPEVLGKALSGMRLVEGQPFEVPAGALDKIVKGEYRPRRIVLTYRGKTREGTRIDAEGLLASGGEGLKMFFDFKAELLLDTTGWCRRAKVDAQIRAELKDVVVGSGAGTGVVTATPPR